MPGFPSAGRTSVAARGRPWRASSGFSSKAPLSRKTSLARLLNHLPCFPVGAAFPSPHFGVCGRLLPGDKTRDPGTSSCTRSPLPRQSESRLCDFTSLFFWMLADLPGKNLSSTSLKVGFLKIVLDWLLVGTSFNSLLPVSSTEFDFL